MHVSGSFTQLCNDRWWPQRTSSSKTSSSTFTELWPDLTCPLFVPLSQRLSRRLSPPFACLRAIRMDMLADCSLKVKRNKRKRYSQVLRLSDTRYPAPSRSANEKVYNFLVHINKIKSKQRGMWAVKWSFKWTGNNYSEISTVIRTGRRTWPYQLGYWSLSGLYIYI